MIIKKTLSEFKQPRKNQQYQAQDTQDLQYTPVFSMGDMVKKTTAVDAPTELVVRMRWQARKHVSNSTAVLQVGEQIYQPSYIYNPDASYATNIEFVYAGYARYVANDASCIIHPGSHIQLNTEDGSVLHDFKFMTCQDNIYEKRILRHGQGELVISRDCLELTGINHVIYRGYGGAYMDGQPLSVIEQVFVTLLNNGEQTLISLKKQSELLNMGLRPPNKQVVGDQIFVFNNNNLASTPVSDILNGKVSVQVVIGDQVNVYKSIDYRCVHQLSNTIEVIFIPTGG